MAELHHLAVGVIRQWRRSRLRWSRRCRHDRDAVVVEDGNASFVPVKTWEKHHIPPQDIRNRRHDVVDVVDVLRKEDRHRDVESGV